MKKTNSKLVLHHETIRTLSRNSLEQVIGGDLPAVVQSGEKECSRIDIGLAQTNAN